MQLASKLSFLLLLAAPRACTAGGAASPVEKVVKLLEDLKTRITEDGKKEQTSYDEYACWCEKTTTRKSKAIEDAKHGLGSLGREILTQRGVVASTTVEIEQTTKDIKENEVAQEKATSIRQKENRAYMEESSELQQAVSALEKAIIVLREAQGGGETALLQKRFMASERGLAAAGRAVVAVATVQDAIAVAPARTLAKLEKPGDSPAKKLSLLRSYAEELARSGSRAKYTPQSASIVGILDEMYSTFSTDLEAMVSEEADKNRNFEDLMATKQEELNDLQEALKKAEEAKAAAEVTLAEATQSYDDTEAQLKADIEFFDTTKEACQTKSDEWSERKKMREEELEGISKALEILTSDEARQVFGKSFENEAAAPALLQLSSMDSAPVAARKAYDALKKIASKSHSLRLARVAAAVKLSKAGHFDKVIGAIDKIVEDLKAEQQSDIEKKDECEKEYTKINSTISDLDWKLEKNQAKIDKLDETIKKLEEDKAQTIKDIEAIKADIEEMKKTRTEENAAFLQAQKDDEDAIKLLGEAKDVVAAYYEKHGIKTGDSVGLLQQEPEFKSEDTPPEAKFSGKGSRKNESKGVVALLAHLMEELGNDIKAAQKEEEESQLAYEDALGKAQKLQADLEEKEVNLGKAITDRKADKTDEEKAKADNEKDLQAEKDYKKEIKPDCDFAIDNFQERMDKRTAELDGLHQAKEFLAGYQPSSALLQSPEDAMDSGAAALLGLRPESRRSMMSALLSHPAA